MDLVNYIFEKPDLTGRISRWQMLSSEYDIDEATASKAICLAKKMITKMTDVLGCDGYNIVQNNEEAAGQTVFHFHMHLIPRYKNDNVGLGWHMGELTEEDKKEILEKLK